MTSHVLNNRPRLRRRLACGALLNFLLLTIGPSSRLAAQETLQSLVSSLMRGHRGAVIVANPATGQLLAVWSPLNAFDRAYPPGSTAKVVVAAACLEEGVLLSTDRIYCRRVPELLGEAYHCSHPPAREPFSLTSALANSCNYFFVASSLRLTAAQLAHWYAVFGFGSPVADAGSATIPGLVRVGESPAEKARAALGEETVLVTPAQMLLAYSAIANRGVALRLHQPSPASGGHEVIRRVKLHPKTFEVLNIALVECVQSGTGQAAEVAGIPVAGKTGTATALDGTTKTHAWFVGYAPADTPEIALVVFLERGTGARDAAPLAGRILRRYFEMKGRQR